MEDNKSRLGEFTSKIQNDMPSMDSQRGSSIMSGDSKKSEIERQLEDFQMYMTLKFQRYQQDILTRFDYYEKRCYQKSKNNVNKFTKCIMSVQKKLEKGQQKLKFEMSFSQYKLLDCFQRQERSGKNFDHCKKETKSHLVKIYQTILNQMK